MIEDTGYAPQKKLPADRSARLSQELNMLMANGWRAETRTDFSAVMVRGAPVNHILHLIATICTVGIWGIIWLLIAIIGGEKKILIQVDEYGTLSRSKAKLGY